MHKHTENMMVKVSCKMREMKAFQLSYRILLMMVS